MHLLERLCMYIINTIINTIYRLCVASKWQGSSNLTDGKICYNFLSMVGRFTCQSEVRVQWAVPDASDFNAHDNSLMIIHTRHGNKNIQGFSEHIQGFSPLSRAPGRHGSGSGMTLRLIFGPGPPPHACSSCNYTSAHKTCQTANYLKRMSILGDVTVWTLFYLTQNGEI